MKLELAPFAKTSALALAAVCLVACPAKPVPTTPAGGSGAASPRGDTLSPAAIKRHLDYLASDKLGGRAVGSPGIALAARYHETIFRAAGLAPLFRDAAGKPSYRQPFALRGSRPDPGAKLSFKVHEGSAREQRFELRRLDDFTLGGYREDCGALERAELLYAGYLITSKAHDWDDLKGADVRGKVLLVEVNEPGNEPGGIFEGEAMTYFGRWTYKFERANALGAKGVLIIHERKGASYGWDVVRNSWSKESFFLPGEAQRSCFHGWITRDVAVKLLSAAGHDRDALFRRAGRKDFKPIALPVAVEARQQPTFRTVTAENVAGVIRAGKPATPHRTVVLSAHFDHLGRDASRQGDQIFNGAVDNSAASAVMLALAQHLAQRRAQLASDVIVLGATAEEVGLLGSRYFASHPPVARETLWANVNLELTNVWGPTRDVFAIGASQSDLDGVCRAAAKQAGLDYVAERGREHGFFYRSDQLSFARVGVPGVWLHEGPTSKDPKVDIAARRQHFRKSVYHTVGDEVKADFDLRGAQQIARWAAAIIDVLGRASARPRFKEGSAFRR
ncbi:MAG: M28 family peptidase [Myxococcales bacterium]|nr:M28 family peptidase [Myxococcales bacterium]